MDEYQAKLAPIQTKLKEGLRLLSQSTPVDQIKLDAAIIRIHGALEDWIRMAVADREPDLRLQVEDKSQTKWKDLLKLAKDHLGFSESDCESITKANYLRIAAGHGEKHTIDRDFLVKYGQFVQQKINTSVPPVSSPSPRPPKAPERAYPTAYSPPRSYYKPAPKTPRYRAPVVLWLAFFLAPPVWAILILSGRKYRVFSKFFAVVVLLASMGLSYLALTQRAVLASFWHSLVIPAPAISTPTPVKILSTALPSPTAWPASPTPAAIVPTLNASTGCAIIWVENQPAIQDPKTRSMVWEETVMHQVAGSGMTALEFYTQVVEKNPTLKDDGYIFLKGKTYLLPKCQ